MTLFNTWHPITMNDNKSNVIHVNFKYDDPATKTLFPETRAAIVKHLYELTEEYSLETYPAEHRAHLGVSVIGDKCSRKLWYGFRWVKLEQHEARMRRLFSQGHYSEHVFSNLLTWMGFFVREIDPATDKQYKFSAVGGHYGGSSDTLALLPWFRNEDDRILCEYKTHNNKSFTKLQKSGLKLAKPLHYAQMCGYGREFKAKYGLYCALNKDNDEIFYDLIELDWNYAGELERKAQDIITAQLPPPKISEQPAYFDCTYCNFQQICHYGAEVEKNCRSCKMATPIDKGEWQCTRFNTVIPTDNIAKEWPCHVSINT